MRVRPRRNRKNELIRKMVEETVLRPANLIYPLFLLEGDLEKQAIDSLPGIFRMNLNDLFLEVEASVAVGICSFVLFPAVPEKYKDKTASYSVNAANFYLEAIRQLKQKFPQIILNVLGDRIAILNTNGWPMHFYNFTNRIIIRYV